MDVESCVRYVTITSTTSTFVLVPPTPPSSGPLNTPSRAALKKGYRHFDCAEMNGNQKEVGGATQAADARGLASC